MKKSMELIITRSKVCDVNTDHSCFSNAMKMVARNFYAYNTSEGREKR